jgi:hypothetical protein
VSPVRYELGFYIPEDGILHSHLSDVLLVVFSETFIDYLYIINVPLKLVQTVYQ